MRGVPSSLSTTRVTNEYMIALHHTSRKYVGTSLKYWVCTRVNMCASIFELLCAESLSCLTDMNFHVKETKLDYINMNKKRHHFHIWTHVPCLRHHTFVHYIGPFPAYSSAAAIDEGPRKNWRCGQIHSHQHQVSGSTGSRNEEREHDMILQIDFYNVGTKVFHSRNEKHRGIPCSW